MSSRQRPAPTEAEVVDAAALLGVTPGAPAAAVKRAWRAAVRVTHPDRVDGSARRAAEHLAAGLNEARDVLLAVAGNSHGPVPFGTAPAAVPAPPTGDWDAAESDAGAAVAAGLPAQAPQSHAAVSQMQAVPDLPRPVAAGPPPAPAAGPHAAPAGGRPRPVRETIGIVVLLALVAAAALVVVYQLFGGLLPQ